MKSKKEQKPFSLAGLLKPPSGQSPGLYKAGLAFHLLWMLFLALTIVFTPFSLYRDAFVAATGVIRGLFIFLGVRFFLRIYRDKRIDPRFHEHWKMICGYGIVFTYVFAIIPQTAREYYGTVTGNQGLGYVILVLAASLFPLLLFLLLSGDKARLAMGGYDKADLEDRAKQKKDKVLRKKRRLEQKASRGFFLNLFFDWIEPIFGAILWVLVINHVLFQLYQIPSESMVPTFLINDRVVVTKTQYGPTLPLTEFHFLPAVSTPRTGQLVTFASPEVNDPESPLHFKSLFTRVFHPFVLMGTLTLVDIDKDENGHPKARLLVKRVIAEPGEKLCILNDKVYKKTAEREWTPMEAIPGEMEYGRTDLYYNENPRMEFQRMNPPVRAILDKAIALVDEKTPGQFQELLEAEKREFLRLVALRGADAWRRDVDSFLNSLFSSAEELKNQTAYYYTVMCSLNGKEKDGRDLFAPQDRPVLAGRFYQVLGQYGSLAFYGALEDLADYLTQEGSRRGYLETAIYTGVDVPPGADPYGNFMIRCNGADKYWRLVFYNNLLSRFIREGGESFPVFLRDRMREAQTSQGAQEIPGLVNLQALSIYIHGFEAPRGGRGRRQYYGFFDMMHLPAFPENPAAYLGEDEYFLLGDNRYNSYDLRYSRETRTVGLDPADTGAFARKVEVTWDPHSISDRYIQGRVRMIFFPLNRARFF